MKLFFRSSFFTLLLLAIILSVYAESLAFSATIGPELSASLSVSDPNSRIPLIVTMADPLPFTEGKEYASLQGRTDMVRALKERARKSQGPLKAFLARNNVDEIRELWIINALAFRAPPGLVVKLESWPEILSIELDGILTVPSVTPSAITPPAEWNIDAIGAPLLWGLGYTGEGVTVATLDTGVDIEHPDIGPRFRGESNDWYDPYEQHETPFDGTGHGTGVMGVILGGESSGSYIGAAPNARWISAKIFDDSGSGEFSKIHQAFQWALDPDGDGQTDDAPDIVNSSWGLAGTGDCFTEFQPDIRRLKDAGISVVVSAGNEPQWSSSPASYPESLAVGATGIDGELSPFSPAVPSSCDPAGIPFPELLAPGEWIRTADLFYPGSTIPPYVVLNGTSFSAPHVSGVMAVLKEAFPLMTTPEIENVLKSSASDLGLKGFENGYGYGFLDALAAYRALEGTPYLSLHDPTPPANDGIVDFNEAPLDVDSFRTLTLKNGGSGLLRIDSIEVTAAPFFTVDRNACEGVLLATGETCEISVAFTPSQPVTFSGSLFIHSNAPDNSHYEVTLAGTGSEILPTPQILISPPLGRLDFGSVPPGESSTSLLTIGNIGGTELIVSVPPSSFPPPPFAFSEGTLNEITLFPGENATVPFIFSPVKKGEFVETVEFLTNEPENPSVSISLRGVGNRAPFPATLVAPKNGAKILSTSVTFLWLKSIDPDGDIVSDTLVYSDSPEFQTSVALPLPKKTNRLRNVTLLAVFPFIGGLLWRRSLLRITGLLSFLLVISACGGDSESSDTSVYSGQSVAGLSRETTYFWKVVSKDTWGETSETEVRTFTIR